MVRKLLFILVFWTANISLSQGLLLTDSIAYNSRSKIPLTRGSLKSYVDLSIYAPLNYVQFGSTCVAHSFAKARSILYCKQQGIIDTIAKFANSFSPYYLYYNNSPIDDYNCSGGLDIEKVAEFCISSGFAKLVDVEYPDYYPFSNLNLGSPYPNFYPYSLAADFNSAKSFRFGNIYRVESILEIKHSLNLGMPVVGGFLVSSDFQTATGNLYMSQTEEFIFPHAMVIVGYDDSRFGTGCIKVANSWGLEWGDFGFIWIPYSIAYKMLVRGYACSMNFGQSSPLMTDIPLKDSIDGSQQLDIDDIQDYLEQEDLQFGFGDSLNSVRFDPKYFRLMILGN